MIGRENVNTSPEPRLKPHLPSVLAKAPAIPHGQHIANQYQNNKAKVFDVGYFEHSKTEI